MFIISECSYSYIYIYIYIYRNPKNTKLVQVRNFYYLFEFKVFRHEERETQFLSMLSFLSEHHHMRHPHRKLLVWPRRAPKIDSLVLASNLIDCFFQIAKILSASGHDVIHVPGHFPIWGFYCDISDFHIHPPTRVKTCAQCVHLTNPCTKQKVLSLTKPKGQIYKTKSLRNYITKLYPLP